METENPKYLMHAVTACDGTCDIHKQSPEYKFDVVTGYMFMGVFVVMGLLVAYVIVRGVMGLWQ